MVTTMTTGEGTVIDLDFVVPKGRIVFDVDGTLIDNEDSPRFEVIDMLRSFHAIGYTILVWSGGGEDYAQMRVRQLGLTKFVTAAYAKGHDIVADLAVDDSPDADFGPNIPVIVV